MITIGWFSPISVKTGIASFSSTVLTELKKLYSSDQVKVVVFYPPTDDKIVDMPYPAIELSSSLLASDFDQLFDIAIYHVGNNEINHGPIYKALMLNSGVVVLHDYVYQHYLAGFGLSGGFVSSSFASLIYSSGGSAAFNMLCESGVLRVDKGDALFSPWETSWSTRVPLCNSLASLGVATVVHSEYSRKVISDSSNGKIKKLFLPSPFINRSSEARSETINNRINIVSTGHIGPTKGLDLLVKAFDINPTLHDEFRVTVVGFGSDPNYLSRLQKDISGKKLDGVFDLVIGASKAKLLDTMSKADVFYNIRYPNTEGASLSLVEQLSFGKPVIAYKTGCYAEVPESACYFIDKINCHLSLIHTLEFISENKAKIKVKGGEALSFVSNHTVEEYAKQLVNFLNENKEEFAAKQKALHFRKTSEIEPISEKGSDWFFKFVKNKSKMQQFYDHSFLIPNGFWESSKAEKGNYTAINILNSRVDEESAVAIGKVLEKKGLSKSYELFGKLVLLSKMFYTGEQSLPDYLVPLFIPVSDIDVWEVLRSLDPVDGVNLAIHALTIKPDHSIVAHLQKDVAKQGFGGVVLQYIRGLQMSSAEYLRLNPIIDWLETHEINNVNLFESLKPFPMDTDIVEHCRENGAGESVLLQGFRDVEKIGVWSGSKNAYIVLKPDKKVDQISGVCSLFYWDEKAGQKVTVVVESLESREVYEQEILFTSRKELRKTWNIKLAPSSGVIIVRLKTDKLLSPKEFIGTKDTRELGVLLSRLEMTKQKKKTSSKESKQISKGNPDSVDTERLFPS